MLGNEVDCVCDAVDVVCDFTEYRNQNGVTYEQNGDTQTSIFHRKSFKIN